MRVHFVKRWLLGALLALLSSLAMPESGRLHADDVGRCYTVSSADAYYYADGVQFAHTEGSQSFYTYTVEDCVATSQVDAINTVANACLQAPIERGTHGVGYAVVGWRVFWNDTDLTADGPVQQQYDCGDVGSTDDGSEPPDAARGRNGVPEEDGEDGAGRH